MFSRSGNTVKLREKLSDVWVCRTSKMATEIKVFRMLTNFFQLVSVHCAKVHVGERNQKLHYTPAGARH